MFKPVGVRALPNYKLWTRYSDGLRCTEMNCLQLGRRHAILSRWLGLILCHEAVHNTWMQADARARAFLLVSTLPFS